MKLALAIVFCSGLYVCAVSAMEAGTSADVHDPEFQRILEFLNSTPRYKDLCESKDRNVLQFRKFCATYDKFLEGYREYEYREKAGSVFDDYHGYDIFFKDVNDEYNQIVSRSENYMAINGKFNLLTQPFAGLLKADLDFKLKFILEHREQLLKHPKPASMRAIGGFMDEMAYIALEEQLEIFIEDLMDSGINDAAKDILKKISKGQDFLKFIGFWFAPNYNEYKLREAIVKMKKIYELKTDKAARIMVILDEFSNGQ